MRSTPAAERQEAVRLLLSKTGRHSESVPLRNTLVQRGTQGKPLPGALAALVARHGERALDLYLLHRAAASSSPWDVTRDARVWARLLGLATPIDDGANTVSKLWRSLDATHGLVSRHRGSRLLTVTVLREDGSRRAYTYPQGGRTDLYFKLPYAYWTDPEAWYATLSLPAKAMLLVSMSLKPGFVLPLHKGKPWYGLSRDTVDRGFSELRDRRLLDRRVMVKPAPLSPTGKTQEHHYTLLGPFARPQARSRRGNLSIVTGAAS